MLKKSILFPCNKSVQKVNINTILCALQSSGLQFYMIRFIIYFPRVKFTRVNLNSVADPGDATGAPPTGTNSEVGAPLKGSAAPPTGNLSIRSCQWSIIKTVMPFAFESFVVSSFPSPVSHIKQQTQTPEPKISIEQTSALIFEQSDRLVCTQSQLAMITLYMS